MAATDHDEELVTEAGGGSADIDLLAGSQGSSS